MWRRTSAFFVSVAFAVVALPPASATKPPGTVIARATGSGAFAVAVAHGQVTRPKALYARFTGKIADGAVVVACLRDGESTSLTYNRGRLGLHRLPVKPADAQVCHITATISGSGRIVAELRAVR